MNNLTVNDPIQKAILPNLKKTQDLLIRAIEKETGRDADVQITAMPDLGLASNSMRMRGGFFTGMYANWQSCEPFVPVDATVNSCGVYIYSLNDFINKDDFLKMISNAKAKIAEKGYNWNFERGNHFITFGLLSSKQPCVVMHASADEFKSKKRECALYPNEDVWYYDKIKTYCDDNERYLRYITGASAERFINIASEIEQANENRMDDIAHLIFGNLFDEKLLFASHYGMPTGSSVAIGCSWKKSDFALLTAPKKRIFIARPNKKDAAIALNPHGFGVEIDSSKTTVEYSNGELYINSIHIENDTDVKRIGGRKIRMADAQNEEVERYANSVLDKCSSKIINYIDPVVSICSSGVFY